MNPPSLLPTDVDARPKQWLAFFDQSQHQTINDDTNGSKTKGSLPQVAGLTVLEEIGHGGMGIVYRVQDLLGREWAMKLVRPDRLSNRLKERFYEEALAMAKIRHPNLVPVHVYHESTTPNDWPYFLMPLYPTTLQREWAKYVGQPVRAVRLLADLAEGLGCLHSHGFIHRDVKPSNILLDAEGRPIVSDFGLAKDLSQTEANDDSTEHSAISPSSVDSQASTARRQHTAHGAVIGTRHYMGPEQAQGSHAEATPAWDVWALGVIGRDLLLDQPNSKPVPRPLQHIIERCLATPDQRYAHGGEFAADLRRWLGHRQRRRRAILGGLIGALLLVVTLLAVAYWPKKAAPLTAEQQRQQARESLIRSIQGGGEVTLLRATGRPDYATFTAGEVFASERNWPGDDAYTLESQRGTLLELVPGGTLDTSYRLRGKLRLNSTAADASSRAGFYIAHQRSASPEGLVNVFLDVCLSHHLTNSVPKQAPILKTEQMGVFDIRAMGYSAEPGMRKELLHRAGFAGTHFIAIDRTTAEAAARYHDIEIEVTPTGVHVVCDGKALPKATAHIARMHYQRMTEVLALVAEPIYQPTGGMGFVVWNASASFKDVRVERWRKIDQP